MTVMDVLVMQLPEGVQGAQLWLWLETPEQVLRCAEEYEARGHPFAAMRRVAWAQDARLPRMYEAEHDGESHVFFEFEQDGIDVVLWAAGSLP